MAAALSFVPHCWSQMLLDKEMNEINYFQYIYAIYLEYTE